MAIARKNKGDVPTHADWNQLVDGRNRIDSIKGANGIRVTNLPNGITISGNATGALWGVVVESGPNGEGDYTDSRYWIATAHVTNTDTNDTTEATIEAYEDDDVNYDVFTVTNAAETLDSSHLLAIGTPVLFFKESDEGTPSLTRYVMTIGGGGALPEVQYMGMHLMGVSQNQVGASFPFFGAYIGE